MMLAFMTKIDQAGQCIGFLQIAIQLQLPKRR